MERAANKAERLLQIEALLLAHPQGLTQAEIARRLGVNRSTIYRYLPELTERFYIYEEDDGRLVIDRDRYLTQVRLTLHEALSLHLAARLMATRTDKHNPHAASALRKLGYSLERLAPFISHHLAASADVMDDAARRRDPVYMQVLETLTRAWSQGRMVHLWHRHERGAIDEYDFAPWFIEPYGIGRTAHVIGWCETLGAKRTFKLERIRQVELIAREYTIPEDFDPRELLAEAWGIWYTEAEPVEVVLKFHPRVAPRVEETQWHPDQRLEPQEDGSLIWRARIAEPQEMLPWVRGWGGDVEVVGPEGLRERVMGEARRLALLYDVGAVKPPPLYQLLWAKTDRKKIDTHPLVCHMIDVAQVALALWNAVLTDSIRAQFADALGLDVDASGRLLAFWAGLHDLGKASPAFQRKYKPTEAALKKEGLPFPDLSALKCYHGTISACTLEPLLQAEAQSSPQQAKRIARAVGGHHGAWPTPREIQAQALNYDQIGTDGWESVRRDLLRVLAEQFGPPPVERLGSMQQEENALLALVSGLISTADWIGSMEEYFPYTMVPVEPARYAERAAVQAHQALSELGWAGWEPPTSAMPFEALCDVPSQRPAQQTIVELVKQWDRPALVIIEAPTGTGKTESALYLADHWARVCRQRGLYVAMPTMATSNQMFTRVQEVLARRYPGNLVNLHLVHSQARWSEDMQKLRLDTADEREGGTVAAMAWFLPRKRTLLAPFGVGTVDQTFLSVLQTRHFFVRLFGLGHKTVIFDEVHAYDTYMSAIFQRLLNWLRTLGTSVVILSATLPAQARRQLLQAYAPEASPPSISYPAVTWAMGDEIGFRALPSPDSRSIVLQRIGREPEAIVGRLAEELSEGGCAAVICNTIRRAQEVYEAIQKAKIVPQDELILFHARFPFAWRDGIEQQVRSRFGKNGGRPPKAIVVATQVIEQSLDLDFDLMITDLAPVDLLIQRAGRLHRHERENRPDPLREPRLLLTIPAEKNGVPDFGRDVWVYERYVLLRSHLVLQGRDQLSLPQETEVLIETVYGEEELPAEVLTSPVIAELANAKKKMEERRWKEVDEARSRLVRAPEDKRLLSQPNPMLEEDSPELHRAFQALTRLGPRRLSLVCLHRTVAGLTFEPDGRRPVLDLAQEPDHSLTGQIARYTLSVTHRQVVHYFLEQAVPEGWREHPLLRDHRVAIFEDGVCTLIGTPYTLRLSRELGLKIEKEAI